MEVYGIINDYDGHKSIGNLVDDWGFNQGYDYNRICTPIYESKEQAQLEIDNDEEKYLGNNPKIVKMTIELI